MVYGNTHRRGFLKTASAGAAIALAGCNDSEDGGNGNNVAGELSTDGPIVIGAIPAQTDDDIERCAKLAVEEINEEGGILGTDVEVAAIPSNLAPAQAREAHRDLILEENADVTMGLLRGTEVETTLPSIAQHNKIHFTVGSPYQGLGPIMRDRFEEFRNQFRPLVNMEYVNRMFHRRIGEVAADRNWGNAAILTEQLNLLDPFHKGLEPGKGEYDLSEFFDDVVYHSKVSESLNNWTPLYDELEELNTDVVVSFLAISADPAIKQWHDQKRDLSLGGVLATAMTPTAWDEFDGACEFTWSANYITPTATNSDLTQPFIERYAKKFGQPPQFYNAPPTYDSVYMYKKAVEESGSLETDDLIIALENMHYQESVMHKNPNGVEFQGRNGEFPHDPVYTNYDEYGVPHWQQWQDGTMELLGPDYQQTAEYKSAPWVSE